MNYEKIARELLIDWHLCLNAQVPSDVISLCLAKDRCATLAYGLIQEYDWGESPDDLKKACEAFSPMLNKLKEHIIYEVLKNGTI